MTQYLALAALSGALALAGCAADPVPPPAPAAPASAKSPRQAEPVTGSRIPREPSK